MGESAFRNNLLSVFMTLLYHCQQLESESVKTSSSLPDI
jgi:hypothetical protein